MSYNVRCSQCSTYEVEHLLVEGSKHIRLRLVKSVWAAKIFGRPWLSTQSLPPFASRIATRQRGLQKNKPRLVPLNTMQLVITLRHHAQVRRGGSSSGVLVSIGILQKDRIAS